MTIHTTKSDPSYRERLGYHSMLLASICCLVAILILLGNNATQQPIAEALRADKLAKLAEVIPPTLHNNSLLDDSIDVVNGDVIDDIRTVYVARQDNTITGYAFSTEEEGYSGVIQLILGIDAEGTIIGVRVISHSETPGLGDKIEISKDPWIKSFNGRSLKNRATSAWAVKKDGGDIDQFTGATITPRAVVNAVYKGLVFFDRHQPQFSAPNPEAPDSKNDEANKGGTEGNE